MKKSGLSFTSEMFLQSAASVLATAAATLILFLIGRNRWRNSHRLALYPGRWLDHCQLGRQWPGIIWAVLSALCFDFFFIPPFFTFAVANWKVGWCWQSIW